MPLTFEKDLLGSIVCSDEGLYNFSADLLIGNVQQSSVRILCDTNFRMEIQLPAISDFQGAYADLLIIISDVTGQAKLNPIVVRTNEADSFQFNGGTGIMDTMGQTTTLRVTTDGLWNVGGDGFTYGG